MHTTQAHRAAAAEAAPTAKPWPFAPLTQRQQAQRTALERAMRAGTLLRWPSRVAA